jgi:hypothetical protein
LTMTMRGTIWAIAAIILPHVATSRQMTELLRKLGISKQTSFRPLCIPGVTNILTSL